MPFVLCLTLCLFLVVHHNPMMTLFPANIIYWFSSDCRGQSVMNKAYHSQHIGGFGPMGVVILPALHACLQAHSSHWWFWRLASRTITPWWMCLLQSSLLFASCSKLLGSILHLFSAFFNNSLFRSFSPPGYLQPLWSWHAYGMPHISQMIFCDGCLYTYAVSSL